MIRYILTIETEKKEALVLSYIMAIEKLELGINIAI